MLRTTLEKEGYQDIMISHSAVEALDMFLKHDESFGEIDLILLDIYMPGMDGIEFTRRLRQEEAFRDIPIIINTSKGKINNLERAFDAGANDFIEKPFHKIELLARVRSALKLKSEMDQRKNREIELLDRERELMEINRLLELANQSYLKSSAIDGLTGITNRRFFDQYLEMEWGKALRRSVPISVIMLDIDSFKSFNDHYGHQQGDECLKKIANTLKNALKQPVDMLARYGGEEFVAVLPAISADKAVLVAGTMVEKVESLRVPHEYSATSSHVTISAGVATVVPVDPMGWKDFMNEADKKLYQAKKEGRNRVAF